MTRRLLIALALLSLPVQAFAQAFPSQNITLPAFVIPASAVNGGGTVTSAQLLAPDGSASAPSYSFANFTNKGIYSSATNEIGFSIGGTERFRMDAGNNFFTISAGYGLAWGSSGTGSVDVSLSRGAANRLDLASGDSLYLVSGGLGVGATETGAGDIQAARSLGVGIAPSAVAGVITTASGGEFRYGSTAKTYSGTNGLFNITDNGGTVGLQFNTGTAAPTVTSCGTGTVTTGSRNAAGQITATGATACTITFGSPAWTNTPFCVVSEVTAARALFISAASTTAITVSGLTAGDVFNYHCIGRQ